MRPTLIAALVSLALVTDAYTQTVGLGIKGGPVASTVKALHYRTNPIVGATAGLYMPWGVAPLFEIQPEVLVTALGAGFVEPDGDRSTVRSLYVQVPVILKKYFTNRLNVCLGYQFNRIVTGQETGEAGDRDITERFEQLDMGFVGGAGFDLETGLDLSLRAYSAMSTHYAGDNAIFPKHRSIQFTAGYRFLQFRAAGTHRHRRR